MFGGGCFWCLEAVFTRLEGVESVESGYMGGHVANPTYQQVCTNTTGHAEVVRISYDPGRISYRELLEVFFGTHDPTTLNRQGNDIGTQYRSVIFYGDDGQRREAEKIIRELTERRAWTDPIITAVEPGKEFYPAEKYHHDYFRNNPNQPYCQFVVAPKLHKAEKKFAAKLKRDLSA